MNLGILDRFRRFQRKRNPGPLCEWFHVTFDRDSVFLRVEPPGRDRWNEKFAWESIQQIVFKAEGLDTSDGIYFLTSNRPESYVVPTEADGGFLLWEEILRRGLFDPDLAIEAASSPAGVYAWPPESLPGRST